MVHHQCEVCAITATMVVTEASVRAWTDHMDTHEPGSLYSTWTWEVFPLDFARIEDSDYLRRIRLVKNQ